MKDEYEDIKKLLIDDIKDAQSLIDRQIAVKNFCDMYWILHEGYKLQEPDDVADDKDDVISQKDIENKVSIMKNALDQLARLGNEPGLGNSIGNCIAIDALRGIGVIADSGNSSVFDQAGL